MSEPISNRRSDSPVIPAGMQWDAAEYADKDGLESDESGLTYFADARQDAWHQLGQQFGRAMTAAELMEQSRLGGWNVRKMPAEVTLLQEDGVERVEIPGQFAVIRTNPSTKRAEQLGAVVGSFYTPIQNEDNCDVLQTIIDESGAVFETAGSLNRGRNTFVTMKLPQTMKIGGEDVVELNIAALNSHDGTSAFTLLVTPVRIVCQNTQAAALKNFRSKFTVSHTKNADRRIADARRALGLSFAYMEEFEREAEAMIAAQMNSDQFLKIVRGIWTPSKDEDSKRSQTIAEKREGQLMDLFVSAETQAGIRYTAWAGYQSIVEYVDHVQDAQKRDTGSVANARALRTILGRSDDTKFNAFARAAEFASV